MSQTIKSDSENLFIGLIIFAGLAMAYLFYSNLVPAAPSDFSAPTSARAEIASEIETINLDFSVLDHILFKQLKVFGTIPVSSGQTGRENPFAPF
ncbi:MAG: hypothetical protein HYT63_01800 [Candidatus Yanofskybacteria bacterium]|nr:hypothetical protein [Candidatus Yanofskybacteria bacterium]